MTAGDTPQPTPPPTTNNKDNQEDRQEDRRSRPQPSPHEAGTGHMPAGPVIECFGGIRPMATKLGVAVSTVQGWKQRGAIPVNRLAAIEAAAAEQGLSLRDVAEESAPAPARHGSRTAKAAASASVTPPASPREVASAIPGRQGGGSAAIVLSILALVVALGGAGVAIWFSQAAVGPTVAPDLVALENRVAALEDPTLAARIADMEGLGDEVAEIAGRVRRLEGAGADVLADVQKLLEAPPAAGASDELVPLATRVSALAARLRALEEATPGAPVERLGALESAFTGLAEALAAVEAQIAEVEATATAGADAATAVAEMNRRLADLATQAAATARLGREVDTLQARLAALGAADVVEPRALAVVLVLQQLRAAAAEGRPFVTELALARQLADGDDEITDSFAALAASAADGVATLGELRERFSAVARDLLQASLGAAADASLLDRTRARLAGVVSVRRTGAAATGDTIDAAINRAQAALDDGDLGGALAALAPYEALAAAPSAGWFAAARARLAADRAIARVDTRVFAILSQARPE